MLHCADVCFAISYCTVNFVVAVFVSHKHVFPLAKKNDQINVCVLRLSKQERHETVILINRKDWIITFGHIDHLRIRTHANIYTHILPKQRLHFERIY